MKTISGLALFCVLFLVTSARGEDLNAIFKRVNDLVAAKNYSKAMDELDWAKKEIEKMHMARVEEFFPGSLSGFNGQKFDTNSVLGFTNIERNYVQGKKTVKLSLTGGTGAGGSALAGFAQLGRMAAMMGGSGSGNEALRIQGRTAMMESVAGSASVTVILDSGSFLKLESKDEVTSEQLKSMVDGIKIDELDTYLKGGK